VRRAVLVAGGTAALALLFFGALWGVLPSPAAYATANPRTTAVIEQRKAEARAARRAFRPYQAWVRFDRISPRLVQAVLTSEDAGFYAHGAFDWHEVGEAAEESLRSGRKLRGASTLTQQLAKNLWFGTHRSAWRKVKEAVAAIKMEQRLSKRRILTLYLNVAEWGDGVFGAEAAAQARFGVSAADLSTAQAAVLAAMLPAPRKADLRHPSRWLARRSRRILDRMLDANRIDASEHAHASAELERILAGSQGPDVEEPPDDDDADT
jgi:monofunctional biosynthetic peptidoglycan transglycosylase